MQNRNYFAGLAETQETSASSNFIGRAGRRGPPLRPGERGGLRLQPAPIPTRSPSRYATRMRPAPSTPPAMKGTLVRLVQWAVDTYGLERDQIIRHYDVTGKECPSTMSAIPMPGRKFLIGLPSPPEPPAAAPPRTPQTSPQGSAARVSLLFTSKTPPVSRQAASPIPSGSEVHPPHLVPPAKDQSLVPQIVGVLVRVDADVSGLHCTHVQNLHRSRPGIHKAVGILHSAGLCEKNLRPSLSAPHPGCAEFPLPSKPEKTPPAPCGHGIWTPEPPGRACRWRRKASGSPDAAPSCRTDPPGVFLLVLLRELLQTQYPHVISSLFTSAPSSPSNCTPSSTGGTQLSVLRTALRTNSTARTLPRFSAPRPAAGRPAARWRRGPPCRGTVPPPSGSWRCRSFRSPGPGRLRPPFPLRRIPR